MSSAERDSGRYLLQQGYVFCMNLRNRWARRSWVSLDRYRAMQIPNLYPLFFYDY